MLSPAVRERFLDRPNARSLHVQPTPRAGGLGLLAGIAATWWAFPGLRTIGVLAFALAAVSILDDLRGLLDGPLFLVAEVAFAVGLSPELKAEVERRAGPTRWGKVATTAVASAA